MPGVASLLSASTLRALACRSLFERLAQADSRDSGKSILAPTHRDGGKVPVTDLEIYRPAVPEGFEWVLPVDDDDFETFQGFDGTRRGPSWKPIPVKVLRVDDQGEPSRPADLPWLGRHVLILTPRATHVLGERLQEFGELLPLSCVDAELFVYNPLHVIDALDEDRSEVVRFTSGRVMKINRHVFRPEVLAGVPIFKSPNTREARYSWRRNWFRQ